MSHYFGAPSGFSPKMNRIVRKQLSNKVVTERFLTGLQEDQYAYTNGMFKTIFTSGIMKAFMKTMLATNTSTTLTVSPFKAFVDGNIVNAPVATTFAQPTQPSLVWLESWLEVMDSADALTEFGQDGGASVENNLIDSRLGYETEHAVVLRSRIRMTEGIDFTTHPSGLSVNTPNGKIVPKGGRASFASESEVISQFPSYYNEAFFRWCGVATDYLADGGDANLWISGSVDPNKSRQLAEYFNTFTGIVFAMPLMKVMPNAGLPSTVTLLYNEAKSLFGSAGGSGALKNLVHRYELMTPTSFVAIPFVDYNPQTTPDNDIMVFVDGAYSSLGVDYTLDKENKRIVAGIGESWGADGTTVVEVFMLSSYNIDDIPASQSAVALNHVFKSKQILTLGDKLGFSMDVVGFDPKADILLAVFIGGVPAENGVHYQLASDGLRINPMPSESFQVGTWIHYIVLRHVRVLDTDYKIDGVNLKAKTVEIGALAQSLQDTITTLQAELATAKADIATLTGRVSGTETSITTLREDLDYVEYMGGNL